MHSFTKIAALTGAIAMGLAAQVSEAREYIPRGSLKIENKSSSERKVCIYKWEKVNILPQKCFRLKAKEWVQWKRPANQQNKNFRVSVLQVRRGFDKLLRSESLSSDTVYIAVHNNNGWTQSRYRPPAPKPKPQYRVKFCNTSQDRTVWLVVGAMSHREKHPKAVTKGYWGIAKGECTTINYSELLTEVGAGQINSIPQMVYRAYTTGDAARRWEGSEENTDPYMCVNTHSKFTFSHIMNNGTQIRPCDGKNEAKKRFLWAPAMDNQIQTARVDF